jgi:hypothetical protein
MANDRNQYRDQNVYGENDREWRRDRDESNRDSNFTRDDVWGSRPNDRRGYPSSQPYGSSFSGGGTPYRNRSERSGEDGYARGNGYGANSSSDPVANSDENWGFGRENRVGSRSYDWGSKEYGSRDINDRNFGREWDKGSSLMPPREQWRGADYVARTAGLESGRNHVGRGPKGYRRSDERIREDASDALERHPHVDASEIEIEVKDGIVTMRGSVEDRQTKRRAEDAIEHVNGIKDIRNELSVNKSLFERAKELIMGESSIDTATSGTKASTTPKSRH